MCRAPWIGLETLTENQSKRLSRHLKLVRVQTRYGSTLLTLLLPAEYGQQAIGECFSFLLFSLHTVLCKEMSGYGKPCVTVGLLLFEAFYQLLHFRCLDEPCMAATERPRYIMKTAAYCSSICLQTLDTPATEKAHNFIIDKIPSHDFGGVRSKHLAQSSVSLSTCQCVISLSNFFFLSLSLSFSPSLNPFAWPPASLSIREKKQLACCRLKHKPQTANVVPEKQIKMSTTLCRCEKKLKQKQIFYEEKCRSSMSPEKTQNNEFFEDDIVVAKLDAI